jgi:hypothetical protein
MPAKRKSTRKPSTKPARRQGLRAKDLQTLIALQDWEAIGKAAEAEEVSYMTLRSVVQSYQDLAEKGNERAKEILDHLQEAGVKAGFRRRGPRASRIAFDEPVSRKIQVVENKKTGNKAYLLSGISLKPYVQPGKGVRALPEDLEVQVVYRKKGTIEVRW